MCIETSVKNKEFRAKYEPRPENSAIKKKKPSYFSFIFYFFAFYKLRGIYLLDFELQTHGFTLVTVLVP